MSDTRPTFEPLLSYRAAGDLIGVSDRTIWALVDRGELPCVRVGKRCVRIDPADLRAYIERGKQPQAVRDGN